MKKFMNGAAAMVAESLEGFVSAHGGLVMFGAEPEICPASPSYSRKGCDHIGRRRWA